MASITLGEQQHLHALGQEHVSRCQGQTILATTDGKFKHPMSMSFVLQATAHTLTAQCRCERWPSMGDTGRV